MSHLPYFLQTEVWAKFWLESNPTNHKYFWHCTTIHLGPNQKYELKSIVYEFPWYFGEKFWYVPKLGVLETEDNSEENEWQDVSEENLKILLLKHLNEIQNLAKQKSMAYIKIDIEAGLCQKLKITNNGQLLKLVSHKINAKAKISSKKIQYVQTITLDLTAIAGQNFQQIFDYSDPDILLKTKTELSPNVFSAANYKDFYNESQSFWKTTNSNIRRYTKKALDLEWTVSVEKSDQNFEAFWQVYNSTKDRQNFVIHSRDYVYRLFQKDNTHLIVLRDYSGNPQCVWFGMNWGNTLDYLYGGNNEYSFQNYGQYLIHLVAIHQAKSLGLKYYDLGGYEKNTGYGKFKENYKGELRTFVGPIDMPIKDLKYRLISRFVEFLKGLKNIPK